MKKHLIYYLIYYFLPFSNSYWTNYDIVRSKPNGYGYERNLPFTKISYNSGNGPIVSENSHFGISVANIGDLDKNGYDDLVVGASGEECIYNNTKYVNAGAIYILFMNDDITVLNYTRISCQFNGGPFLQSNEQFGFSVATIGDLNGDGVNDIAVGAPSIFLSGVYVLFMQENGTAKDYVLIRGEFIGDQSPLKNATSSNYTINGPPISYDSRFGTSIAGISDINGDSIPDIAVGSINQSTGESIIYILFLSNTSQVLNYTQISSNVNGGPTLDSAFTYFGCSIASIGDMNGDEVNDIAVGAKNINSLYTKEYQIGAIYILYLTKNGTVLSYQRIGQEQETVKKTYLPMISYDQCGTSVVSIGDINHDNLRQQHPDFIKVPHRKSINDIIIGCPQGSIGNYVGRLFIILLKSDSSMANYAEIPSVHDTNIGLDLSVGSQFGYSLAKYQDIDITGINGLVVGAPGDNTNRGSIYIIFMRRRRYHPKLTSFLISVVIPIILPSVLCVSFCIGGIILFFYIFRRRPDEIEIIVKKSGLEINKKQKRKRQIFGGKVYADEYVI